MGAAGRNWAMASGRCSPPCCPAPPKCRSPHPWACPCPAGLRASGSRPICPSVELGRRGVRAGKPKRCVSAERQVSSGGAVMLVSGVGAKGTSKMALSGGRGLGPKGATRLAGLLREAPPLLASLNLRLFLGFLRDSTQSVPARGESGERGYRLLDLDVACC